MNLSEKKLLKQIIRETILSEQRAINEHGLVDKVKGFFQKPAKPTRVIIGQNKPYPLDMLNPDLDPRKQGEPGESSDAKKKLAGMISSELGASEREADEYAAFTGGVYRSNSEDPSAKSMGIIADKNIEKYREIFSKLNSADRKQLIDYYKQFNDPVYKKLISKFEEINR